MSLKAIARRILGESMAGRADYFRFPKLRDSWGGPFNGQDFRQQIFLELLRTVQFAAIVETGAYRGTTTDFLYESSQLPVRTVELDPRNYGYVQGRFLFTSKVIPSKGDSRAFLRKLVASRTFARKRIFFYLDAHWNDDLPLREEIQIIFENFFQPVVMIDDFKVPGDEGYGFDDYGEGKSLSLEYLGNLKESLMLAVFFPAARSASESGAKRGSVVLANETDVVEKLRTMKTLVLHADG